LLESCEKISPTGRGFGHAEAEKRQRHFGEDKLRNENRCLRKQDARCFRQNVAAKQIHVGGAETSRGVDEITLFDAEHNSADQAGWPRPSDHADDDYNEEKSLERTDRERQKRAQGKKEIEPWEREEKFSEAHQELVAPATVVAGGHADQRAEEESDPSAKQAGEKRDLPAIENARELIPAIGVAAEKVHSGATGAEQMQARWDEAEQTVSGAAREDVQRNS